MERQAEDEGESEIEEDNNKSSDEMSSDTGNKHVTNNKSEEPTISQTPLTAIDKDKSKAREGQSKNRERQTEEDDPAFIDRDETIEERKRVRDNAR